MRQTFAACRQWKEIVVARSIEFFSIPQQSLARSSSTPAAKEIETIFSPSTSAGVHASKRSRRRKPSILAYWKLRKATARRKLLTDSTTTLHRKLARTLNTADAVGMQTISSLPRSVRKRARARMFANWKWILVRAKELLWNIITIQRQVFVRSSSMGAVEATETTLKRWQNAAKHAVIHVECQHWKAHVEVHLHVSFTIQKRDDVRGSHSVGVEGIGIILSRSKIVTKDAWRRKCNSNLSKYHLIHSIDMHVRMSIKSWPSLKRK